MPSGLPLPTACAHWMASAKPSESTELVYQKSPLAIASSGGRGVAVVAIAVGLKGYERIWTPIVMTRGEGEWGSKGDGIIDTKTKLPVRPAHRQPILAGAPLNSDF